MAFCDTAGCDRVGEGGFFLLPGGTVVMLLWEFFPC